jgi:membrane associated rhomboid family serine protease
VAGNDKLGPLDRAVELLAKVLNAIGLNGTRLLWKWNQRRQRLAETGLRTEILWRSTKGRHKMCPSCRALVDRSARACPECGAALAGVRAPGVGRLLANLLPGASAATSLLMLVNGFWFLLMILAQIKSGSSGGNVSLFSPFDIELMARFGAGVSRERMLSTGAITGGEWWRLITPIFLHAGIIHFLFNSYLLLNLGPIVEEIYGTARYWVIYLAAGIAGSVASQAPRFVITVGASGAIMGLIGLLLVAGYRSGGLLGQSMKSLVIRLAVYSVILSLFFNIDHLNHIGGFACGALLALIVPRGNDRSRFEGAFWQVLSVVGVLLVLLAFYQVAAFGRSEAGA